MFTYAQMYNILGPITISYIYIHLKMCYSKFCEIFTKRKLLYILNKNNSSDLKISNLLFKAYSIKQMN